MAISRDEEISISANSSKTWSVTGLTNATAYLLVIAPDNNPYVWDYAGFYFKGTQADKIFPMATEGFTVAVSGGTFTITNNAPYNFIGHARILPIK